MPWTRKDYPVSMKNLDPKVREKAIDIANRLVEDGYDDDRAIPIAIAQAKTWYENRGEMVSDTITHRLKPGGQGWVLESVDGSQTWSFETKEEAMLKVKTLSEENKMKVMIHDSKGRFQKVY
jgi:uncharacterized protein YdaT